MSDYYKKWHNLKKGLKKSAFFFYSNLSKSGAVLLHNRNFITLDTLFFYKETHTHALHAENIQYGFRNARIFPLKIRNLKIL